MFHMKFRKRLVFSLSFVGICFALFTGCKATLQPGGAYSPTVTNATTGVVTATQLPDMEFYNVDAAYLLARSTINAVFQFERDNRAAMWKISPNIKHTLDSIRPQAVKADSEYHRLRAVYMANPVPSGLDQLQTILARISQLATTAAAALPTKP
jgi:hypothetical protein